MTSLVLSATAAGVMWVVEWAVLFTSPTYYAPESGLDYAAAVTFSLALLTTSVALLVLGRTVTPRRARLLVFVAAVEFAVVGVGNSVEDVFGVDLGDFFFYGGVVVTLTLALAGILSLTTASPRRWVGIPILLTGGGFGFELGVLLVVAWIGAAIGARRGVFGPSGPRRP